ncbi:hypothetical protein ACFV28_27275 [Streptomyces sp. NPDC059720]|uniref:hypothetical protein n=1 Tax=Streptomyces sp. NPDC059720 TaxID=3346924 RepID=UPI0036CC6227
MGLFRAAYWEGDTVLDVMKWLSDPKGKAPLRVLYSHEPVLAEQVDSSINIAEETQSGIYQNARTAVSALLDEKVLSWVTPDKHHPRFDPEEFALSKDTLYLLSKKGGPSSAVVAALADAVFTAGAEAQMAVHAGGLVLLRSRQGTDMTGSFPEIRAAALAQLPPDTGLDGELVVWEAGRLAFERLQQRGPPRRGRARPRAGGRRTTSPSTCSTTVTPT